MKHIYLLTLLAFFISCSNDKKSGNGSSGPANKFHDTTLVRIYTLQDERNTNALLAYLDHSNPLYREEAALAFASVQDTAALKKLGKLLNDEQANVRKAAAYAFGQAGDSTFDFYLLEAIKSETNSQVMAEMLESLGKCCSRKGLQVLCETESSDSLIAAGQMWGLFRAGARKLFAEKGISLAIKRLDISNAHNVRLGAANFLGRTRGIDLTPYSAGIENAVRSEHEYDVRMCEVSALGKIKPVNAGMLCTMSGGDPDYRVRINAIRAMKGTAYADVSHHLYHALKDKNVNVAITSADFILENAAVDSGKTIYPPLSAVNKPMHGAKIYNPADDIFKEAVDVKNWRVSALLLSAAMKISKNRYALNQYLRAQYQKSSNPYEKAALLTAMGKDGSNYTFISTEIMQAEHLAISTNGIDALAEIRRSPEFKKEWEEDFNRLFMEAVEKGDVALVGTVATAMRDTTLNFKETYAGKSFLDSALGKLSIPRDIETYIEVQKTLDYLKGNKNSKPAQTPYNHPINWEKVKEIPREQKVLIVTSKGNIRLQVFVEDAPGSVFSFLELAKAGFYNNKAIHRVVPNFVAQDGCPRGDGWGGTDYSLRSEFAPLHYTEGYVGLASAGKDTESCQWFITHSPTPHLDGRYTIFGKVIEGMDIVHQLEIGDKIQKIVAEE
jgi:cyclophilin family peptidyl-prolyl cis-trans isomerase/HEAT repeat protein